MYVCVRVCVHVRVRVCAHVSMCVIMAKSGPGHLLLWEPATEAVLTSLRYVSVCEHIHWSHVNIAIAITAGVFLHELVSGFLLIV